jgi:hypothetical protein
MTIDMSIEDYIVGVWGTSDSDIFAVGSLGVVFYYNGDTWSKVTSGAEELHNVWGVSPAEVFIVGSCGLFVNMPGSRTDLPPDSDVKTKLVFGQQPTSILARATISPAVSVQIKDADRKVITSDNSTAVTLAIGTNPGSITLSGETSVVVTKGVATFNSLQIDKAGNGYTLTAMSGTLTPAISHVFKVVHIGDANEDGNVTMGDVTRVEREILGLDPFTLGVDANKDGSVNMGDVTRIERIILGLDP